MNPQNQLSSRVKAVIDALAYVRDIRNAGDFGIQKEGPQLVVCRDKETKMFGVIISQGDDPIDALLLDDNGLKGMHENSMYLPWTDDQGEAFFAAIITFFFCDGEILRPPVCGECAVESNLVEAV